MSTQKTCSLCDFVGTQNAVTRHTRKVHPLSSLSSETIKIKPYVDMEVQTDPGPSEQSGPGRLESVILRLEALCLKLEMYTQMQPKTPDFPKNIPIAPGPLTSKPPPALIFKMPSTIQHY